MSSEKKMIDLPDNIGEMTEEETERLVDEIYAQLFGSSDS